MRIIEEIKENIISRIGNARIKNRFGNMLVTHPENNDKHIRPLPLNLIKEYNKARPRKQKLLCYAPFKNMYFGMDGSASACCYNRTHSFGKYPEKSIHDMWFGEKAKKLGEYIKCNDLSLGCEGCKYLLEAKNFTGIQAMYFDHYPVNRNNYPSVMQFELSNVCNLECTMCTGEFSSSIRKNREKLPAIPSLYDDAFIEQLREFIPHLSYAKFYGGEPFLVDEYYKIWVLIAELNPNIKVEIQTNATIMNNRVKQVLGQLKCNINISIDSLQKETYESIRVNAKYETVWENIEAFMAYRKKRGTRITLSVCPMRTNWKELPDFIDYCNANNTNVFFHMVWEPAHMTLWNLDYDSLSNIYKSLSKNKFPLTTSLERKNQRRFADYLQLIEKWRQNAKKLEHENIEQQIIKKRQEQEKLNIKEKLLHFKPIINNVGAQQALLNELARQLEKSSFIKQSELVSKIDAFELKLNWISARLPEELKANDLFESLLAQRPIEKVLAELEKENKEELLKTAINYGTKVNLSKM